MHPDHAISPTFNTINYRGNRTVCPLACVPKDDTTRRRRGNKILSTLLFATAGIDWGEIYEPHKRSIRSIAVVSLFRIKWNKRSGEAQLNVPTANERQRRVLICSNWLRPFLLSSFSPDWNSIFLILRQARTQIEAGLPGTTTITAAVNDCDLIVISPRIALIKSPQSHYHESLSVSHLVHHARERDVSTLNTVGVLWVAGTPQCQFYFHGTAEFRVAYFGSFTTYLGSTEEKTRGEKRSASLTWSKVDGNHWSGKISANNIRRLRIVNNETERRFINNCPRSVFDDI